MQGERRYPVTQPQAKDYPRYVMYHTICDVGELETLREALLGVVKKNREVAIREEYKSLQK
jgi:hypothetical protein